MSEERVDLVGLLAAHRECWQVDVDYGERQWVECSCDEDYDYDDSEGFGTGYRRHLADVIERAHQEAARNPQASLLDYSTDAEDCNACSALNDQCPFHAGVAEGIDWMCKHLRRIAVEPERLNLVARRRAERDPR